MSGGHFDFAYFNVQQFADKLEMELLEPPSWWDFSPEAISRLREILLKVRHVAHDMKATEWLLSGDHGENTFMELTNDRSKLV